MNEDIDILKKAEEFLQVFRKGEEFTKKLIKGNEQLRFRIAQLEETVKNSVNEKRIKIYEERIKLLEDELKSLSEKYQQVEEENKDIASKYVEIETENNNLANLYVASYHLHSTLDLNEVLKIVFEIIINLIGAEKFGILLMDEKTNELIPVASEGLEIAEMPRVKTGVGIIGSVAKDGESFFSKDWTPASSVDVRNPIVCIPLKIKEHVIGVLTIYSLFVQKTGFSNMDYELFNMLAGHAATAIFSSKLYTQSERKLATIQGFLDFLSEKPKR
jgi:transcriptional regulator with GAF, ATPase, and Fis domain